MRDHLGWFTFRKFDGRQHSLPASSIVGFEERESVRWIVPPEPTPLDPRLVHDPRIPRDPPPKRPNEVVISYVLFPNSGQILTATSSESHSELTSRHNQIVVDHLWANDELLRFRTKFSGPQEPPDQPSPFEPTPGTGTA